MSCTARFAGAFLLNFTARCCRAMMLCDGGGAFNCNLLRPALCEAYVGHDSSASGFEYAAWCAESSCTEPESRGKGGASSPEEVSRKGNAAAVLQRKEPPAQLPAKPNIVSELPAQQSGRAVGDCDEPLLASNDDRFTMYPVRWERGLVNMASST